MKELAAWALLPVTLAASGAATLALSAAGLRPVVVTALVVGACAVVLAVCERLSPVREDWLAPDQPLYVDALHYVLGNAVGVTLGYTASERLFASLGPRVGAWWPSAWPLAAQLVLAIVSSEGVAYWQHRAAHRWPWLWRFHALHHHGGNLNVVRAARFHVVDLGSAAFFTVAPLHLCGAPERVLLLVSVLNGVQGLLDHVDARVRTPAWLDGWFCTPAVHRAHHSIERAESDANFGTTLMVFDRLFGTYVAPSGPTPARVGVVDDPTPRGFFAQVRAPFRR